MQGSDTSATPGAQAETDDIGARIASALVLGPAAVAAAVAGGPWIAGAAGAAVVAMTYEWARMSEPRALATAFAFALTGALGAVMLASRGLPGWAVIWLGLVAMASAARRKGWRGALETGGGVLYVGVPCIALLWLRGDEAWGLRGVLALFAVIWSADTFAYFGGRFLGGPKLMPEISPHKTWAGLLAGSAAGGAAGALCASWFDAPLLLWLGVGMVLAAIGLGGDLFESALKRRFGVKDASRLIPGHGGVLDRVDGLMAAVSALALLEIFAPAAAGNLFPSGGP